MRELTSLNTDVCFTGNKKTGTTDFSRRSIRQTWESWGEIGKMKEQELFEVNS